MLIKVRFGTGETLWIETFDGKIGWLRNKPAVNKGYYNQKVKLVHRKDKHGAYILAVPL